MLSLEGFHELGEVLPLTADDSHVEDAADHAFERVVHRLDHVEHLAVGEVLLDHILEDAELVHQAFLDCLAASENIALYGLSRQVKSGASLAGNLGDSSLRSSRAHVCCSRLSSRDRTKAHL